MLRTAFLVIVFAAATSCAGVKAEPIVLHVEQLRSFTFFTQQKQFGPLEWRGGLYLTSPEIRFGGLSSLELSSDGTRLLAVTDRGSWFRAKLTYMDGHLSGISAPEFASMRDRKGRPLAGTSRYDSEALAGWTPGDTGKVIVGFETNVGVGVFDLAKDGLAARMKPIPHPKAIDRGRMNRELESIGRFASGPLAGSILAISELNRDEAGDIRAWVFGGRHNFAFTIKRHGEFSITDLTILPDGDILTVERSFDGLTPGMALRRIRTADIVADGAVAPELLFAAQAPFYAIDNMEGIAVSQTNGETRVTLVSDDNFNRTLQRTLILQFALKL